MILPCVDSVYTTTVKILNNPNVKWYSYCPFIITHTSPLFTPPPFLSMPSVFHLYNFIILKCYINGFIRYITFWIGFFLSAFILQELLKLLHVSKVFFSLYCWVVSHEIYVPQLPVLLLKGWDHSSSWALQITLLWTLCTGFYCGCKFSFLWDTLPRMQLLCPMVPVCLVL